MAFAARRAILAALLTVGVGGSAIAATASGTLSRPGPGPAQLHRVEHDPGFWHAMSAPRRPRSTARRTSPTRTARRAQLKFELDGGANGTVTARKMSNGAGGLLNYALYRDTARTQNFAQGANARSVTLDRHGLRHRSRLWRHPRRAGGRGRHLHRHGPDHAHLLSRPRRAAQLNRGPALLQERRPALGEVGMVHRTVAQGPALRGLARGAVQDQPRQALDQPLRVARERQQRRPRSRAPPRRARPAATTRSSRPIRSASSAASSRAENRRSLARATPTSSIRRLISPRL